MKQKPKSAPQIELDRLYSESGNAEPASGLDRMILARADQALGKARRAHRRPVLAGLATASVALVALVVVLQQAPPAPEPAGPFEHSDAGSVSEERYGPNAGLPTASAARKTAGETRREPEAPAARSRTADFEARLSDSKPAAPPAAEARSESEASVAEPMLQSITVTGSRIASDEQAVDHQSGSPHELLFEQLRALIADGKSEQARELLRTAEQRVGRIALPEDLAPVLGDAPGRPPEP